MRNIETALAALLHLLAVPCSNEVLPYREPVSQSLVLLKPTKGGSDSQHARVNKGADCDEGREAASETRGKEGCIFL